MSLAFTKELQPISCSDVLIWLRLTDQCRAVYLRRSNSYTSISSLFTNQLISSVLFDLAASRRRMTSLLSEGLFGIILIFKFLFLICLKYLKQLFRRCIIYFLMLFLYSFPLSIISLTYTFASFNICSACLLNCILLLFILLLRSFYIASIYCCF